MPTSLPSVTSIVQKARQAFRAQLPGSDAWAFPNSLNVVSKVIGALTWGMLGRVADLDNSRFISKAQGPALVARCAELGITQWQAQYAAGKVDLDGPASYQLAAGATFTSPSGLTYTTAAPVTLSNAGVGTVQVTCSVTGTQGNVAPLAPLTCSDNNITSAVVDASGIGGGAAIETYESLRKRGLFRLQNPPMGGSAADYVTWVQQALPFSEVWVDTSYPPDVKVYVLMPTVYPTNAGVPQAADIAAAQAFLNQVAPAQAVPQALAPTAQPINIALSGILPDSTQMRQTVANQLAAAVATATAVSTTSDPYTLPVGVLYQALATTPGLKAFTLAAPTADIAITAGSFAFVNSVAFS